ncbi:MAG: sigma factor-like helix-turn-helix DNA-binding protein [Sedimentisphaerales bacterium]|jgi:7-cyano-7-deazaguanine synthase in queuosine biosynthesis/DNA-binding CsgD family transcriptional regulator
MAYERMFLCGGSEQPRGRIYPPDTETIPLILWGRNTNIALKISDLTRKMVANLPALYADLLEIATYVYCADQTTPRGGSGARDAGANWRRNMRFVISVRRPDFWSGKEVVEELVNTLGFLSDDNYEFSFVPLEKPPPIDNYFEFPTEESEFAPEEIITFSGGLDSLAGAINEIFIQGKKIALISHRSAPKIAPIQKELHKAICERCKPELKPLYIPVWITNQGISPSEHSQRSRSFLYASLATTVAVMFGRKRIKFYENGVTSLNLPIAEQVLGARATRTTHPKIIRGFQNLFSLMAGCAFEVETPFFDKTKTEVVEVIKNAQHADLMKKSVSCSHVFGMTRLHTHCGCCSQCIDRRLAILAAGCVEYDPDEMYKVDVFRGERTEGKEITMAESYVRSMREMSTMTELQFFGKYGDVHRVIPYIGGQSDEAAAKIFSLCKRNGEQVQQAIQNAVIHYSADLSKGKLPTQCLLRQLFGAKSARIVISEAKKGIKRRKRRISSELSKRQQEVFRLIRVEGKTPKQAAIEMQCSSQNISKLLKKAEAKVEAQQSRSVNLAKAQPLPKDSRGQENLSDNDTQ